MIWGREFSLADHLALKPKGYFTVKTADKGQIVSVQRPGQPVEQYLCASPGVANQLRMALTDEGLCGYVEDAQ